MEKEKLYKLIQKYNAGVASEEEKKVVEQWYDHLQVPLNEIEDSTLQAKKEQVLRNIQAENNPAKHARRLMYRWVGAIAAAAAIFFLISYPFDKEFSDQETPQNIQATKPIPPGSRKAELIMPDGKRINVSTLDEKKILSLYSNTVNNESSANIHLDKKYELIVPKGGEFKFILPDSTKVWLNANSKLSFNSLDKNPVRRVQLQGEAYFEVAKNKDKPFYVDTEDAQIRVLGTHFNVKAYEAHTRATLLEGSVAFSNSRESIVLKPGQFAENNNSKLKMGIADVSREIAWKNNEFYFKQDNIKHITDQLERWYDISVEFGDNISMQTGYTGRIKRTATLQEVVEMLNYVIDVKMEINGNKLFVGKK